MLCMKCGLKESVMVGSSRMRADGSKYRYEICGDCNKERHERQKTRPMPYSYDFTKGKGRKISIFLPNRSKQYKEFERLSKESQERILAKYS